MRLKGFFFVAIAAATLAATAADRPVAMIVDVDALRSVEDGVQARIAVRVAPEDQSRLGRDVMLWAELADAGGRVLRRGWALKIDDPVDPLHVEMKVPGGPHLLRIDLEGSGGRVRGVWFGEVDFSASDPDPDPVIESETASESVAVAESVSDSVTESEAESVTEAALASVPDPDPVTESEAAFEAAAVAESEPESVSELDAATGGGPVTAVAASSVPASAATDSFPVAATDPATATATDTVTATATVPATATATDPDPAPAAPQHQPPTPAPSLNDLGPRVDLAVAVDLHSPGLSDALWISRTIKALALEIDSRSGVIDLRDHHRAHQWMVSRPDLAEWIQETDTTADDQLPVLVERALDRGTRIGVVLVLTDGLGPRSKKNWPAVIRAANEAGAVVLVAGLWSEDFPSGLRKDLRRLADATRGSVFYLQGPEQADALIERFIAVVDEAARSGRRTGALRGS